jgi:hypothetical protein
MGWRVDWTPLPPYNGMIACFACMVMVTDVSSSEITVGGISTIVYRCSINTSERNSLGWSKQESIWYNSKNNWSENENHEKSTG